MNKDAMYIKRYKADNPYARDISSRRIDAPGLVLLLALVEMGSCKVANINFAIPGCPLVRM
jgi:hypothetical protein